jgi:hypothetical protein
VAECFERDGISLRCPQGWTMSTETTRDGWTVTLQSDSTAFVLVTLLTRRTPPAHAAQTVLRALQADYRELESRPCTEIVADREAVGYEVDFFALDLLVRAKVLALACTAGTLCILQQLADSESSLTDQRMQSIIKSLAIRRLEPTEDEQTDSGEQLQ